MSETDSLSFPDGPRADLEEAITSLLAQGERVMRTQGRLRSLLRASQTIVEQIELPQVLRSTVEAAIELVDADYGAMGVLTPEKDALEQFIFFGIPHEVADAIGHLPRGRGLLGALINDPQAIRLRQIADDPRAVGFPAHHPPMHAFLGVPIRIRGEVFGNLYLANDREQEFTEEDEQLLTALAATAGFAIDNARLFADVEVRERWATAAAELASAIIAAPTESVLDVLAESLLDVSAAVHVAIVRVTDDGLHVVASRGDSDTLLPDALVDEVPGLVSAVLEDGEAHAGGRGGGGDSDELPSADSGPALALPLRNRSELWGVILIERARDGDQFTAAEILSASDLASRAGIALELAGARQEAQRAILADDRHRIARDLHDHVIQQLFGTGLGLQGVAARIGPGVDSEAVADAIDQLDDAIRQIRTVIFALSQRDATSVRHRLLDVVGELSSYGHRPPAIRFMGPVDHLVRDELATDLVAVARELLSNALRHSNADRVSIDISAAGQQVTVNVVDDGRGIPSDVVRRGLANLDERARARRGRFKVETGPTGTSATWSAPLEPPSPAGDAEGAL